jgi:hypothetical protein
MNPQLAESWFGKGRVLQRFGKQDDALEGWYHESLEITPEDADIRIDRIQMPHLLSIDQSPKYRTYGVGSTLWDPKKLKEKSPRA